MTRHSKQTDKFIFWWVILTFFAILFIYVPGFKQFAATVGGIIILFIAYHYWKRYHKMQIGQTYQISHHCPNCGRLNTFKYPKGYKPEGSTSTCHYCGNKYTR